MLRAEISVTLKRTVADPQGLTVKHALESLGYKNLGEVRVGRLVVVDLNSKDKEKARQEIEEMCKKLLANPIVEDYRFELKGE
ncbi:MAG: phosphoribosylformylglycinamidine synthase subunit PurS [Candidatus Omnitrophica bacterium]|nr:phosphoribosylformylglycinamidine synthase subunit PurS [Candidatus Omnitrophota bacterium]